MIGYRLYYLDTHSHIVGREEFFAEDDDAALMIAAPLREASARAHSGLMLWQGARQIFSTDEVRAPAAVLSFRAGLRDARDVAEEPLLLVP